MNKKIQLKNQQSHLLYPRVKWDSVFDENNISLSQTIITIQNDSANLYTQIDKKRDKYKLTLDGNNLNITDKNIRYGYKTAIAYDSTGTSQIPASGYYKTTTHQEDRSYQRGPVSSNHFWGKHTFPKMFINTIDLVSLCHTSISNHKLVLGDNQHTQLFYSNVGNDSGTTSRSLSTPVLADNFTLSDGGGPKGAGGVWDGQKCNKGAGKTEYADQLGYIMIYGYINITKYYEVTQWSDVKQVSNPVEKTPTQMPVISYDQGKTWQEYLSYNLLKNREEK